MRIAYFSPLPPARSGIADYSRELLPHLAQCADITLFVAEPEKVDRDLRDQFVLRSLQQFPEERWHYDMALYQMGNSEFHEPLFHYLLKYPGVVDLHDYFIHHFLAHTTMGRGNFSAYARELAYVRGVEGMDLAQDIRLGHKSMPIFELPLNKRVLDVSLGLIIHSNYVADQVRRQRVDLPVQVVPLFVNMHTGQSRRRELGLAPDDVLFASFGLITTSKQIELALRSFKQLRQTIPNAHYLLVGESMSNANPKALIRDLNLTNVVHEVGFVADIADFIDWIYTADVVINLRYPTVGESSSSALRALAAGRPVIVFDQGWYGELPDGAALKVPPLDQAKLLDAMLRLARSPVLRRQIGQAAQQYAMENCTPSRISTAYISALRVILEHHWERYA